MQEPLLPLKFDVGDFVWRPSAHKPGNPYPQSICVYINILMAFVYVFPIFIHTCMFKYVYIYMCVCVYPFIFTRIERNFTQACVHTFFPYM